MSDKTERSDNGGSEYRYGWFGFTPQWMQRFNTAGWFLFWMFMFNNFGSMVNNGLLGVVLSSIETRFGLTSTESSWIVTSYDVAGIAVVLLVSIYGNSAHRPRWSAIGVLMVFIGTMIVVLPHFTTGVYDPTVSETDDYICGNRTGVNPYCERSQPGGDLSLYLIVFIIGRIIAGLGSVPCYTLGLTYMDDVTERGKFGLYTGIWAAGGMLGPAIAYVAGGFLLELHTDFYQIDTDNLDIDSTDPRWVGNWWLGFIIGAVFVLIIVFPFAAYPKDLPGAAEIRKQKVSEVHNTSSEDNDEEGYIGRRLTFSDVMSYSKVLLTNPTFMGIMLYGAIDGILVAGFTAFGPKYFENEFNMDASLAGTLFGVVTVPGAGGGSIFGGWLISYFNLTCVGILRAMVILTTMVAVCGLCFLVWCEPIAIAGVTIPYNGSAEIALDAACMSGCDCYGVPFSPVCSYDNVQYFSPCHAGCTNFTLLADESKEYMNCSCILDSLTNAVEAEDGTCSGPSCPLVPLFMVFFFLAMFLMFTAAGMGLPVMFRSIPKETKNLGVSISSIVSRLVGWLPGPLLFGAVFDNACLLWQDECGETGACLYYDNELIGLHIFFVVVGFKVLSLLLLLMAWAFYKPPKRATEDMSSKLVPKNDSELNNNTRNSIKISQENSQVIKHDQSGNNERMNGIYFVGDNRGTRLGSGSDSPVFKDDEGRTIFSTEL